MNAQVSAETPDWQREYKRPFTWDPGRALIANLRTYQRLATRRGVQSRLLRKFVALRHRFWSVIAGADIPLNCEIGGGLVIPHPNGIVINPGARIGPNCMIFQQVTIGAGSPVIGGHVDIGAGAKILGNIRIGSHARIGANAVVTKDVPAFATAIGVPARIIVPEHAEQ